MAHLLESFGALDKLKTFVSDNGRLFYGRPAKSSDSVTLRKTFGNTVQSHYGTEEHTIIPFMAGQKIDWEIAG